MAAWIYGSTSYIVQITYHSQVFTDEQPLFSQCNRIHPLSLSKVQDVNTYKYEDWTILKLLSRISAFKKLSVHPLGNSS